MKYVDDMHVAREELSRKESQIKMQRAVRGSRIKPTPKQYEEALNKLDPEHIYSIISCYNCGYPVIRGMCCEFCDE